MDSRMIGTIVYSLYCNGCKDVADKFIEHFMDSEPTIEESELDKDYPHKDGWTNNVGVEPNFDRVDYVVRDGATYFNIDTNGLDWNIDGTDKDIVKYRPIHVD